MHERKYLLSMQEESGEGNVADAYESAERSETPASEQSSSKEVTSASVTDLVEIFVGNRLEPKVLKLFDVRTFRAIENHQQLERKLSTLGFVDLTGRPWKADDSGWKEYAYGAEAAVLLGNGYLDDETTMVKVLRPRLPHPNISMHHPYVYKAFLFLVGMFIGHEKVQEHFQVRCVPAPAFWYTICEMEVELWFPERLNIQSDWFLAHRKGYVDEYTTAIVSDIPIFKDAVGEIDASGPVLKRPGHRS